MVIGLRFGKKLRSPQAFWQDQLLTWIAPDQRQVDFGHCRLRLAETSAQQRR
jgi:hypothetical protein